MTILVTGAAGFIGSHLVDELLTRGADVIGTDDFSLGDRRNLDSALNSPHFTLLETDLRDAAATERALGRRRYAGAYIMAANSDIAAGSRDSAHDLQRTFFTVYNTLRAIAAKCDFLVFASTSAVYGDNTEILDETTSPLRPVSYYGAAKLAGEGFLSAFAARHDARAVCYRFPNVVGSRLTHGVIFDFVRKLIQDPLRLEILGDGTQEKPYLHVDDLIRALLRDPPTLRHGVLETFLLAGEGRTTVDQIAEMVISEMGLEGVQIVRGDTRTGWPGDVPEFQYNTEKIKATGWRPSRTSDEAVRTAIQSEVARWRS